MPVDVDNRLHRVLLIGWFLDGHTPRPAAGVHAPADERAPDGNQITGNAFLRHQGREMIRSIPLAYRGEIDKQIGNIFLQVLLTVLGDHRQML